MPDRLAHGSGCVAMAIPATQEAIDWVETIPFHETRNYVQRVMENLQVYRARLNDTEVALSPERDLSR